MLKPYDEYKQTNIPWLEEVPSHWECKRIKEVLIERKENNSDTKTTNILSLTNTRGVIPYSEKGNVGNKSKEKIEAYKLAYPNDIVINSMNVIIGSVGLSKYFGAVSPVYYMLYARENDIIEYFNYIFQCKTFQLSLKGLGNGILEIRMRIPMNKLNNVIISIPPREEQDQIVKYLDWQISKINTLIKAKKKQIELLKEQKHAIINQALTKGLDDTVPMKDSGIEWLGEVPEHWTVNRLKRFCKTNASISNLAKAYVDNDELVFLPMGNITVDGKIDCSLKRLFKEIKSGYSSFAKHDVVIAKITPCFENGKGAYLDKLETEIGYGTTELITIRAYNNILPKYLYLVTMSQHFRLNGEEQMTGSAGQKRVPTDYVANFIQGIPPLDEQQAIATYIEEKIALINNAIIVIEKEIELVSEYKTSLICSVVTGKVDVRDAVVPEFEVVGDETSEDDEGLEVDMDDSN